MIKYLIVFFLSIYSITSLAQINKSQVLIYGDSEASWAAAVQSARSGVKTLWLRNKKDIGNHFTGGEHIQINSNDGLDAGLWAEFLSKNRNAVTPSDSISNVAKQDLNPQVARNVFTGITDTLKNLTIVFNTDIKNIKKSRKQWRVTLSTNETLKVSSIVDGSDDGKLLALINEKDLSKPDIKNGLITATDIYENNLYRTGLVVFEKETGPTVIPASLVLTTPAENIFIINQYPWLGKDKQTDVNNLPILIQSGQAIGASAAYCAFFETTVDEINIRTLQGELLTYHGQILPFQDIDLIDIHFSEIQRIAAVGILKGEITKNGSTLVHFNPDKSVSSKEIQPIILNLYSRSQIWFSEKKIEQLKVNDLLSLLKFTALKGDELDADVEKGWTQRFHFTGEYDATAILTRRQVAVLMDYYLKPFNVKVDNEGGFKY